MSEYAGIVLLAGALVAMWLIPSVMQRRRGARRAAAHSEIMAAMRAVVSALEGELVSRYPRIPFRSPPFDLLGEALHRAVGLLDEKDVVRAIKYIGRGYCERVVEDYSAVGADIHIKGVIESVWTEESFWITEESYRATLNGRDPADWDVRRQLIHRRDGKQCLRCGVSVLMRDFHAHHIRRRSDRGTHDLDNLATLCKSCHAMMEGHEGMRAIRTYWITSRGLVHADYCRSAGKGRRVTGSLPRILSGRVKCCRSCDPWTDYHQALTTWKPEISSWARTRLAELTSMLKRDSQQRWVVEILRPRPLCLTMLLRQTGLHEPTSKAGS